MIKLLPITSSLEIGDIIYHPKMYMGQHYFYVASCDDREVCLRACNEKGTPTQRFIQVALRYNKLINTAWQKIAKRA